MKLRILTAAAVLAVVPLVAEAQVVQGTVNGAKRGANQGEEVGGPVGGVVGGAVGAGVGAVGGALGTAGEVVGGVFGVEERPRFREFVVRERRPSFALRGPVRVGVVLPERGVEFYEVPPEYRAKPGYRYAVVNDRPVLVEPRTRRIVEVIE